MQVFCVILLSPPRRGSVVDGSYCTMLSRRQCFFSLREGKCFSHIKRSKIAPHCQFEMRKANFCVVRYLSAVSKMHTSIPEGAETL